MKVLELGPYPPPYGGVQTHLVALVDGLRKRGITCDVMNLTRFRRPSQDGIFYPSSSLAVLSHLLSHRYDIIHLHIGGRIWPRQLALGLVCSGLPKTKCVLTFHSGGYPSSPEGRSAHARTLRGYVFRRFDRIIAVNEEIAALFRRFGLPDARIRVISPFVASVQENKTLPQAISDFLGRHRPLLISVGLLEPEYDFSMQMQVLGNIRLRHPNAGLLIVGSGSLDESLRREASGLPYAEHIFLSGDLAHSAALAATARSDLMLRTTWYDGDAMSVREALHLGVPVIASNNGMRPPGVKLIPARNPQAVENAVYEVLAAPGTFMPAPCPSGDQAIDEILRIFQNLVGGDR